jgi:carbonic anhydrase
MICAYIALVAAIIVCVTSACAAVKVLLEPLPEQPPINWPLQRDPSITVERRSHE